MSAVLQGLRRGQTKVGAGCGSWSGPAYAQQLAATSVDIALDIVRRHAATLGPTLVTHRFALDDIAAAFRTAADKTTGAIMASVDV